jgi:hypothetical protein
MATRALIGHLDKDRKFVSTYNHYDGYPDGLGKTLEKFFNTDEKARVVSNMGYISSIDPDSGEIESKYKESADKMILDDDIVEAGLIVAKEIDTINGEYGYIWFGYDWFTIKNNGIEGMAAQFDDEMAASGMFMVDENKIEENIMEAGYEAKWAQFLNEAEGVDFNVIKTYIAKEKDIDGGDFALDAYMDSLKNSFRLNKNDYADYEMNDYIEDFDNYVADKMDS